MVYKKPICFLRIFNLRDLNLDIQFCYKSKIAAVQRLLDKGSAAG